MTPSSPEPPRLTFWFEFASTYAYLAAMRVEGRARAWGVALDWRPFLLGPVFAAQGWETSPFLIYPAKGRFMWRDMARRAEALGLGFRADPPAFPVNSVPAARLALAALERPEGPAFVREVYAAQWAQARDVADAGVLADCAREAGLDPAALAERAEALRPRLRDNTEAAMAAGVFGAPSFTAGGELFWGADQMEDALSWAAAGRLAPAPGLEDHREDRT